MERTLVILKPDAYARQLLGVITSIFENKGLVLIGCKLAEMDESLLATHYAHLTELEMYPALVTYMTATPVVFQCWEGPAAVQTVRAIIGVTDGRKADPGTIRGRFSSSIRANLVHASDSLASANAEIARFFAPDELFTNRHPLARFMAEQ